MSVAAPASTSPRYAFVFVCQAGEIEAKALLLAASLKNVLHCQYELIAAVPSPASIWGELSPDTRRQLDEFGVRIVPIENPIDPDYGIGNKLACIDVPARADKIVFLDSDILCLRDFGDPACLHVPFAAKPADLRTFAAAAEAWMPLYAAAGVTLPRLHLPTTVSGEFGLPYFNSGVIFVDAGIGFGRNWIDCANTIRVTPEMREQRHWLDQVSLPIAMHRLGLAYSALDERYNFPAHLKPLPDPAPFFCHYHWPRIVHHEPVLLGVVRALAAAHPAIARVMVREPEWAELLDPALPMPPARAARPAAPDPAAPAASQILIAGIPDSGAKELLQALERCGCTTSDEPAALPAALVAGHVTPHSALDDAATNALRCELAFLSPPGAIGHVLPRARAIACVRDPFDTIDRWKTRPHAEVTALIASTMASVRPWLKADAFAQLVRIAGLEDAAEQRAAWWWWLAQRLLERIDELTIVHVDAGGADALARALRAGTPAPPISRSPASTTHASMLDENDRQAIQAICLQAAADLGVADC